MPTQQNRVMQVHWQKHCRDSSLLPYLASLWDGVLMLLWHRDRSWRLVRHTAFQHFEQVQGGTNKQKGGEQSSYHSATANPPEGRGQVMRAACSLPREVKEPERVPFCTLTHSCRFKDKSQEAASFHWLSLQSHTSSLPASFPQALATSFDQHSFRIPAFAHDLRACRAQPVLQHSQPGLLRACRTQVNNLREPANSLLLLRSVVLTEHAHSSSTGTARRCQGAVWHTQPALHCQELPWVLRNHDLGVLQGQHCPTALG